MKKLTNKILPVLLSLVLMLNLLPVTQPVRAAEIEVWDGSLDFSWYDENNVQSEYHIKTPAQWEALAWICSEDLSYLKGDYRTTTRNNITSIIGQIPTKQNAFEGVQFYLDNDLDMGGSYDETADVWSGPNYYPIGGQYKNDGYTHAQNQDIFYGIFYGSFNGQGHTVYNIYCSRGFGTSANLEAGWYQSAGLFGRVGAPDGLEAPATDIIIENVAVDGFIESSRSVGGIVGKTLHVDSGYSVIIRNCMNFATVTNSDKKGVGGIVGASLNGCYIINCANFGRVICGMQNGGGITGISEATCISCYNVGDIYESVYNHGQAYGTDNMGTELINFYYASDSVMDTGSPAIYSAYRDQDEFDFTAIASEDMQSLAFLSRLNLYAEEYGYWVIVAGKYDGYPVPEVFGGGGGSVNPPSTVKSYAITLVGEDRYTVTLDDSGLSYRARSIFSINSDQTKTLTILPDEDYIITNVTQDGGAGGARLRKISSDTYELSNVTTDLTIAVQTTYSCTHRYVETDRLDANCTESGYVIYECEKCGDSYTEILPAGAHVYETETVDPVGTEMGYTTYTCIYGDDTYTDDYTWLVRFDAAGGSETASQIVAAGSPVSRPEEPVHANGKMFAGWYTDEERTVLYDFSQPVTQGLVLYADWADTAYHVGFSGEHADAVVAGAATPEAIVREEGGSLTFSVEPEYGYELTNVTAEEISVDSIWDGSVADDFAGGSGTQRDPYLISNGAQLAYLAQFVNTSATYLRNVSNGVYFKLTRSIDLNNIEWTPIGNDMESNAIFQGIFDGDGHTITNLYIDQPDSDGQGLFGYVFLGTSLQSYGVIQNLTVTGNVTGKNHVGGIAGFVRGGRVSGCASYVNVTGTGSVEGVGGIAGTLNWLNSGAPIPRVENCVSYGTVSGFQAGGIVGFSVAGTVSGCINYGDVYGTYQAGGVVGYTEVADFSDTKIVNCGNHGSVTGTGTDAEAGGVAGSVKGGYQAYVRSTAYVTACYNVGDVVCTGPYTGGVIGYVPSEQTTVENCYNRGSVTSTCTKTHYVGGIVGRASSTYMVVLQNCYNTGATAQGTGAASRGGIAGMLGSLTNVRNNYWYNGYIKAWASYSAVTMSGNARRITDETVMKVLGNLLGTAYKTDTEEMNEGCPVLFWQESPGEDDASGAILTDDGDGFYTLSNITSNLMVYLTTQRLSYEVTFITEYGTAPESQTVLYENTVTEPNAPVCDNYRFEGWFLDENYTQPYDFQTPVKGAVTLYAKWAFKYYTVDFRYADENVIPQQRVEGEPWLALRPEDPVRSGYGFTGWYTDRQCTVLYDFDTILTSDLILYAGWEAGVFTVSIDPDNGTETQTQTVSYGDCAQKPAADPEKEGYIFDGWYLEEQGELTSPFHFSITEITGDTTIRAKWVRALPVIFQTDPEQAQVKVELRGQVVLPEESGEYLLGEGLCYSYGVSAPGYRSVSDLLIPKQAEPDEGGAEENGDGAEENGDGSRESQESGAGELSQDQNEDENQTQEEEAEYIVVQVTLEPIGMLNVSFDSEVDVIVGDEAVTSLQVEAGDDLTFMLSPQAGLEVAQISLESEEPPELVRYTDVWDGFSVDADWQGAGTASDPYLISSAAQLAGLAWYVNYREENLNGVYFRLIVDLDLDGWVWTPIGGNGGAYRSFQGSFDGNGHTITNLYINSGNASYVGLFGYVFGAKIYNLTLKNTNVTGLSNVGALAGAALGETQISGCSVSGTVKGTHVYNAGAEYNFSRVGGLVGAMDGAMVNCTNLAQVTGDYCIGGLVGSAENDFIEMRNCAGNGTVTGNCYIGGLIGLIDTTEESSLSQSQNLGEITGGKNVGGAAGMTANTVLSECVNSGAVLGEDHLGGLVGLMENSRLNSSYNAGAVSLSGSAETSAAAGGLAGTMIVSSSMENCYSVGTVSGEADIQTGGLAGAQKKGTLIKNCFWLDGSAKTDVSQITGLSSQQTTECLLDYQMKYDSFLTALGDAFVKDYCGQNAGYPIMSWQNKLVVSISDAGVWTVTLKSLQESVNVSVSANQILYDVIWEENKAYTITPSQETPVPLTYGEDFSFTVTLSLGYEEELSGLVVMANEKRLTAQDGVYTIENIQEKQIITVSGFETGTYTVTFDANGGTLSGASQCRVSYPSCAPRPANPIRIEEWKTYTFLGWFLDDNAVEKYDFSSPVTEDITLYAGWYFDNGMYMVYDLNLPQGASASAPYEGLTEILRLEEQGKGLAKPPQDPTCTYRSQTVSVEFLYWMDENGEQVDLDNYIVPALSSDEMEAYRQTQTLPRTTLYAKWQVVEKPTASGVREYEINSAADLLDLADLVNSGQVSSEGMVWVLKNNIYLSDALTIGTSDMPFHGILTSYSGNLEDLDKGAGTPCYTITLGAVQTDGLFACLGEDSKVYYVNVAGNVQGDGSGPVGILANINWGDITGCGVSGSISGVEQVGGVIGLNYGDLTDLTARVTVYGLRNVGGIVGESGDVDHNIRTSITNCVVKSGSSIYAEKGQLTAGSSASDSGRNIGGIVGLSVGTITGCENAADIRYLSIVAPYQVGGISGMHYYGSVIGCKNSGQVLATAEGGGIIGTLQLPQTGCEISRCENSGSIEVAGRHGGGIVGRSVGSVSIRDCVNTGDITHSTGQQGDATSSGTLSITDGAWIGGIAGAIEGEAELRNCYNTGDISVGQYSGGSLTGGLAGYVRSVCTISYCFSTGALDALNAAKNVGGLVGYTASGNAVNAYWYGEKFYVASNNHLAGYADGSGNILAKNFYYCKDADTAYGSINAPSGETVVGKPGSAFRSGEVSYLIDFGKADGSRNPGRDLVWSLLDETEYAWAERYPTVDEPEYYMVTLRCGEGGSAQLVKLGGDTVTASANSSAVAYVGRGHTFAVNVEPGLETREEIVDNVKITYHWEVDQVNAVYVLDASGASGEETAAWNDENSFVFPLSQQGNYVVTVTFKEVSEEEELEEPPVEEPDEDDNSGNGNGTGIGSGGGSGEGNGNGSGVGNGDGNGDGRGEGSGSGNGVGDGDNGYGSEAGGGEGGREETTTITEPSTPGSGEPSSEQITTQVAPVAENAVNERSDRSEVENDSEGEKGGSLEGGGGSQSPDTADVVPKVYEMLKNMDKEQIGGLLFLLLLLLVVVVAAAVKHYRRYRRDELKQKEKTGKTSK